MKTKIKDQIPVKNIQKFRAAYDKIRVAQKRIEHLNFISQNPGCNIGQIFIALRLPDHSSASQHITDLEKIGWVNKKKEGKQECCYITDRCISDMSSINKFFNKKDKRYFF